MIFCRNWRQFFRHFAKWFFPKPTIFQNPIIIIVYAIFQNAEASFSKMAFFTVFSHFEKWLFPFWKMRFWFGHFPKWQKCGYLGLIVYNQIIINMLFFCQFKTVYSIVFNIIWYDTIWYCRIFNCIQSIIIQYNLIQWDIIGWFWIVYNFLLYNSIMFNCVIWNCIQFYCIAWYYIV